MELAGIGVSPGIAVGEALLMERETVPVFRLLLPPEGVEREVQRLSRAAEASRQQIQAIKARLSREIGAPHAYILDAQLLMLDDPLLVDRSVAVIRDEHVNAEWALTTVSDQLHELFSEFGDSYLKERTTDLDDVLGRVLLNLAGAADAPSLSSLPSGRVLIAVDITPSEAATLDWEHVVAITTDNGSRTDHAAIIARSLGIPAVAGLHDATKKVPAGALVVVDGDRGALVVEPSRPALEGFRAAQAREVAERREAQETRALDATTRDGFRVHLEANLEFPEDAATAQLYGAEGVGLFRSEYMLARSRAWPTEEHQVEVYERLIKDMRPHPVTVRTWDVGKGDLSAPGPSGISAAFGERALRLAGREPEPFRTQIRALLRAALKGPLRIMFPFVGGPSDLAAALALLEESRDSLRRSGIPFAEKVPVGITLELPSAALTADLLAPDVDFFSVGTNDLIQYLLAVDRSNSRLQSLYQPLHPAVLRAIRHVIEAAERGGTPLGVCGEMASEPLHAMILVGMGVKSLSMSPGSIPKVKAVLRRCVHETAAAVAKSCLGLSSALAIERLARQELGEFVSAASEAGGALSPEAGGPRRETKESG